MLHDVVGASGLAIFAEVGLLVFFAVFVIAVVRVVRRPRSEYDALARMPLEDDDEGNGNARLHDRRSSET